MKRQKSAIFPKKIEHKYNGEKNYCKIKDNFHYTGNYRGAAGSIYNLKCSIPKEIPVVFHNGSNYGYHFIRKELTKGFSWIFNSPGENNK